MVNLPVTVTWVREERSESGEITRTRCERPVAGKLISQDDRTSGRSALHREAAYPLDLGHIRDAAYLHNAVYLHYEESRPEKVRNVLKLSRREVVISRYGAVRWSHTFVPGVSSTSTMEAGGMTFRPFVETRQVDVSLAEGHGEVRLEYLLTLAGQRQEVRLTIRFCEGVPRETEETPGC